MAKHNLPSSAGKIADAYPEIWQAYENLGAACGNAGPLDAKTKRLVKLSLALASRSEGATHSHTRRALEEGIDAESLRHVALLSIPTLGFPQAVAALTWIEDVLEGK